MGLLLLLFLVVPAVELILLMKLGEQIGVSGTLALIVVTGVVGASLARRQGTAIIRQMQNQLQQGEIPTGPLLDGVIILVAGALLITPGVLTDVFGFLCLIPPCRALIRMVIRARIQHAVREGRIHVSTQAPPAWAEPGVEIIDVEPEGQLGGPEA